MERNYIITEDTGMLLPYFRNIWNADGWREDRVDAGRHGAYCMYRIGDRDRALKFLLSGLSEGIPKPELCCDLGWWFFSAGRYRDAIFWYGQAVQAGKLTGEDGFVMPECGDMFHICRCVSL